MAINKASLTKEFLNLMKESSVDCNLNAVESSHEYINCFAYPSESVIDTGKESYGFNPDIKQDNDYAYIQKQQGKKPPEVKNIKRHLSMNIQRFMFCRYTQRAWSLRS